ncbi:hypothetical protein [Janthinobacterium sp. CG_S6]|uniref:hypothetical protein n=1 Tax=unclassified Janthinobacterium TaxID=2610881 RepID=UPI0003479219|nr:hypothetical protein [Janthinobacterium sp. CG_S6]
MAPETVHAGRAAEVRKQRQSTLAIAFQRTPAEPLQTPHAAAAEVAHGCLDQPATDAEKNCLKSEM